MIPPDGRDLTWRAVGSRERGPVVVAVGVGADHGPGLVEGLVLLAPPETPHGFRNVADDPLLVVWVHEPGTLDQTLTDREPAWVRVFPQRCCVCQRMRARASRATLQAS